MAVVAAGRLCRCVYAPPVDRPFHAPQSSRAMPKPRKVEEPAAPYGTAPKPAGNAAAPSPAQSSVRYASAAEVKKAADKIFAERKELFRKLAQ